MVHDITYYRVIQGTNGVHSMKEAKIRSARRDVTQAFQNTINWETVLVNGGVVGRDIEILPGSSMDDRKFKCKPGEYLELGDLISWRKSKWLVDGVDADDQINMSGTMRQCNFILRWQLANGTIHEEIGYNANASKYSFGEIREEHMDVADFTIKVGVQMNSYTLGLKRNMRFLAGRYNSGDHPMAFEISKVDKVMHNYLYDTGSSHKDTGIIELILHETQYNELRDNAELMVADYTAPAGNTSEVQNTQQSVQGSGWFG